MTMYSEFDRHAAAWLRELTREGLIPNGEVDERDIREVQAADLAGHDTFHAFAGIGGWPYALRLAGWPDDRPVWTGSCPCQPFSAAGKRKGKADTRHVWPEFLRLIAECRPPTIFGEQVASPDGCEWLAGVFADLESVGYRVAGADLCAAGVGAAHRRQRLYWVADTDRRECPRIDRSRGEDRNPGVGSSSQTLAEQPRRYAQLVAMGLTQRSSSYAESLSLLDGIPGRVALLRGAGNAIVPQVAATFVRAVMES